DLLGCQELGERRALVPEVVQRRAVLGDVSDGDPVDLRQGDLGVRVVVLDVELGVGVGRVLQRGLAVDARRGLEVEQANTLAPAWDAHDGVEATGVPVLAVADRLLGEDRLDAELVQESHVALDVPGQVLGHLDGLTVDHALSEVVDGGAAHGGLVPLRPRHTLEGGDHRVTPSRAQSFDLLGLIRDVLGDGARRPIWDRGLRDALAENGRHARRGLAVDPVAVGLGAELEAHRPYLSSLMRSYASSGSGRNSSRGSSSFQGARGSWAAPAGW